MSFVNRREFLGSAMASAAVQDKRTVRLGILGCGWYGLVDWNAAWQCGGVEAVGLCDVDSAHLEQSATDIEKQQGKRPKTFKNYQDLLAMDELDALILATPPHWHALQFIAACGRKLPVYCEKPLSYDVREGLAMIKAWKQAGNLVQVGFQRRKSNAYQQVKEYLASGNAGQVVQVDVNIHYTAGMLDAKPQDPPPTLDWEQWCGPAPKLPYSPNIGHKAWRLEKTTGHGHLVDWGIHLIDATRVILGEDLPKRVTAMGGLYELKDKITTPDTLTAHFEFARCPVVWRHRIWGAAEYTPETSNGIFIYGQKETVFVSDQRWEVVSKGKGVERRVTESKPPVDMGKVHMAEFLDCVRSGKQPSCTVEDAFRSTATVQLGMISYETGRTITYDSASHRISGDEVANRLLLRPYRSPYKHPAL